MEHTGAGVGRRPCGRMPMPMRWNTRWFCPLRAAMAEEDTKIPIYQLFEYVKSGETVVIELNNYGFSLEGKIIGFDEFMNLNLTAAR